MGFIRVLRFRFAKVFRTYRGGLEVFGDDKVFGHGIVWFRVCVQSKEYDGKQVESRARSHFWDLDWWKQGELLRLVFPLFFCWWVVS